MNATAQNDIKAPRDIRGTKAMAEYLSVSDDTLLRMVNRVENPIPHFRMTPRVIRFDRERVDEWLAGQVIS